MKISFSGIFIGFICMGVGCFFLVGTWGVYLDYTRVKEYSGRVSGQVTKKHFQTAADGSGNYYLDYCFVPSSGSKISTSSGISKQQVGQVAAEIRCLRKPEPYKGKGIKFVGERIIRKSGKSGKEKA